MLGVLGSRVSDVGGLGFSGFRFLDIKGVRF